MPLIQPRKEQKFITQKIKIDEDVFNGVKKYMEAFNLGDDLDHFFETAAKQVLEKDKDYQKYLKEMKKKTVESTSLKPSISESEQTTESHAMA